MSEQFDEFSKSLAEALPRRETLRRFGAGMFALFLSPLGLEAARRVVATDPCKTFCGKCRTTKQKNQCLNACNACGKKPARLVGSCGGYVCCPSGYSACGNYCADLSGDSYNCGACGNVCQPPGPNESGACIDGRCEYWCVEGTTSCDGICTNLNWDVNNCGACGNACGGDSPYCQDGVCLECAPGLTKCSGSCTDTYWDRNNCGGCGNVCPESTPFCTRGVCTERYCNGTDLLRDPLNCGACGYACGPDAVCEGGECWGYNPGCTPDHPYWPNC